MTAKAGRLSTKGVGKAYNIGYQLIGDLRVEQ